MRPSGLRRYDARSGSFQGFDRLGKRFVEALELLHVHFPTWPLYEPDWVRDLFRYALALKEQYFPRERLPFG